VPRASSSSSQSRGDRWVGGLVEQQQIRRVRHQHRQRQPAPLPDGQLADPHAHVARGEQTESLQGYRLRALSPDRLRVGLPRGAVRPADHGVLRQQPDAQPAPPRHAGRVQLPGQHREQRGLSCPVRARDQEPVGGKHVETVQGEPSGYPDVPQRQQDPTGRTGGQGRHLEP